MNKPIKIAIVGAGLGGCYLALTLQEASDKSFEIYLFEKDYDFHQRRRGYGLTIQQEYKLLNAGYIKTHKGISAFNNSVPGLVDQIAMAIDTPSSSHYKFNTNGDVIACFGRAFFSNTVKLGETDQTGCKVNGVKLDEDQTGKVVVKPKVEEKAYKDNVQKDLVATNKKTTKTRKTKTSKLEKAKKWSQSSTSSKYNLHLPRQVLRGLIYNRLAGRGVKIYWSKQLVNMNNNDELIFADGSRFDNFDLVVGADGIFSQLRSFKLNNRPFLKFNEGLNYLGLVYVLGITSLKHPLLSQRTWQTVDGNTRLFVMPLTTSETMFQLSFPWTDEESALSLCRNFKEVREIMKQYCGHWHDPVNQMFESTRDEDLLVSPVWDCFEPCVGGSNSKVTLIGDAAHPMSPFKAQGANQVIIDAESLKKCLLREDTISKAIESYEAEMKTRSFKKVIDSRNAAQFLHSVEACEKDINKLGISDCRILNAKINLKDHLDHLDETILQVLKN